MVELTLGGGDSSVTMQDVIELEVRIVNRGATDLWVFGDLRWGFGAGLGLNVGPWDADGPLPLLRDHEGFRKEDIHDGRSFVRLPPGGFIGQRRRLKVGELVRRPGQYRLWVEYEAPVAAEVFDRPFWSKEKGTVISRPVLLNVRRVAFGKD